jgi:hypothetical protein
MKLYTIKECVIASAAFHKGTPLYPQGFSPAYKNRGVLVSVPVNGNKSRAGDTFPRTYRDHLPFAERTVQAVPVLKHPDTVFRQKTYNTHGFKYNGNRKALRILRAYLSGPKGDLFDRACIIM